MEKEKESKAFLNGGSTSTRALSNGDLLIRWRNFAIVLIILNILLLVIALTVVVIWKNDREKREVIRPPKSLCLPCGDLSLHQDDDVQNFVSFTKTNSSNGEQVCCADTHSELKQLVDLFVTRKYREDQARSSGYNMMNCAQNSQYAEEKKKYAARVVNILEPNKKVENLLWDYNDPHSFINPGIKYNITTGRFNVTKKGFYYIYSQVTFQMNASVDERSSRSMYKSLCHFVYHQRANMLEYPPEKLLESSQSKCQLQSHMEVSNSTSYIGAVFYMEKGEEVMVRVSDQEKLTDSCYSNYFGLHMI